MTNRSEKKLDFLNCAHELANEVRHRHNITTYPVPVAAIANNEGAVIKYLPMVSEGALTRTSRGYTINVNENAAASRKRYTIAHEIGHILFDRLTGTYAGTRHRGSHIPIGIEQEERFCQQFAAALLIPEDAIADFGDWKNVAIIKLYERARSLQVSAQALLWRVLEQLPYEGGALCFRFMPKPTDKADLKLRLDWGLFPNAVKKMYLPRYDAVRADSPIHRALTHNRELLCRDVKLDFGSLRGKRSLIVKAFGQMVLAIVLPHEVDPAIFSIDGQMTTDEP